jgi:hypothetical protein
MATEISSLPDILIAIFSLVNKDYCNSRHLISHSYRRLTVMTLSGVVAAIIAFAVWVAGIFR